MHTAARTPGLSGTCIIEDDFAAFITPGLELSVLKLGNPNPLAQDSVQYRWKELVEGNALQSVLDQS